MTKENRMIYINTAKLMLSIIVIAISVVLLLQSCAPPVDTSTTSRAVTEGSALKREVDQQAGVVCWYIVYQSYGIAMDCMPISETDLGDY